MAHENVPFLHGLAGWQVPPEVQATHALPLQTMPVPQDCAAGVTQEPFAHMAWPTRFKPEHCGPAPQVLVGNVHIPSVRPVQLPPQVGSEPVQGVRLPWGAPVATGVQVPWNPVRSHASHEFVQAVLQQ